MSKKIEIRPGKFVEAPKFRLTGEIWEKACNEKAELLSLLKEALDEWEGNWMARWDGKERPWSKHPRIAEIRKKISKAE